MRIRAWHRGLLEIGDFLVQEDIAFSGTEESDEGDGRGGDADDKEQGAVGGRDVFLKEDAAKKPHQDQSEFREPLRDGKEGATAFLGGNLHEIDDLLIRRDEETKG